MQMLKKDEFKKELLNKYEISYGVSDEILDGMIDRGFIPSVTNEAGDKTYNVEYYLNDEDAFDRRVTEYKNTRGYLTDLELQKALIERDSSLIAKPVNTYNDLARRGLLKSDDFYVVRKNEIFLFSPTLIYSIEEIKAAISELDEQLEAEEMEALGISNEFDFDTEDEKTQEDVPPHSEEDEEIEDEYWDFEDDEALEKKERAKKKAREQKKRDELKKKEEALKKENDLRLAEKARLENAAKASAVAVGTETVAESAATMGAATVETTASNPSFVESGADKPHPEKEPNTTISDTKTEDAGKAKTDSETVEDKTQSHINTAGTIEKEPEKPEHNVYSNEYNKANENPHKEDSGSISGSEHNNNEGVYSAGTVSSKETDTSKETTSSEGTPSSEKNTLETKTSSGSAAEEEKKRRAEELERKKKYEEERLKNNQEVKPEPQPVLRNEDGTMTFSGSSIGKDTSTETPPIEPVYSEEYTTTSSDGDNAQKNHGYEAAKHETETDHPKNEEQNPVAPSEEKAQPSSDGSHFQNNYTDGSAKTEITDVPKSDVASEGSHSNEPSEDKKSGETYKNEDPSKKEDPQTDDSATSYDIKKSEDTNDIGSNDSQERVRKAQEEKEAENKRENELKTEYTDTAHEVVKDDKGFVFTGTSVNKSDAVEGEGQKTQGGAGTETYVVQESAQSFKDRKKSEESRETETVSQEGPQGTTEIHNYNPNPTELSDYGDSNRGGPSEDIYTQPSSEEGKTPKKDTVPQVDEPTNQGGESFGSDFSKDKESKATNERREIESSSSDDANGSNSSQGSSGEGRTFTGTSVGKTDNQEGTSAQEPTSQTYTSQARNNNPPSGGPEKTGFGGKEPSVSNGGNPPPVNPPSSNEDKATTEYSYAAAAGGGNPPNPPSSSNMEEAATGYAAAAGGGGPPPDGSTGNPPPYKINIPLADGSYMTFEAKQDVLSKVSVNENGSVDTSGGGQITDPYDNFNTRLQAAYVSSDTVLSQKAIEELISTTANHAGDDGFQVKIVKFDEETGKETEKIIYNSKRADMFIGDVSETYRQASRVDKLPESSAAQDKNDQKVLFAVGVQNGGEVKDGVYIPPNVPVIHPRVLNELKENGVTLVEANGVKVEINDLLKTAKKEFSIVEHAGEGYQNAQVAKEIIQKATTIDYNRSNADRSTAPKRNKQKINFYGEVSADTVKKAEKAIASAVETKKKANDRFSLEQMSKNPEFVPPYLRNKFKETDSGREDGKSYTNARTSKGIGGKIIGDGSAFNGTGASSRAHGTEKPVGGGTQTATQTRNGFNPQRGNKIGDATEYEKPTSIKIDFSNPVEVENYAQQLDGKNPELAKEIRTVNKEINGDVAIVLAANSTGSRLYVDGARVINNPEIYIAGKAQNAEIIAAAIEKTHPENAAKIRELSKNLNGDVADIYHGINATTGEYMLKQPEVYIKGRSQDAEAVAKAIEERYPETAKKIRDLSSKLNDNTNAVNPVLREFGATSSKELSKFSMNQIQEMLSNTHVLKGHAKEVEDIAASIEMERPDIAKQLREASKAQNGEAADIFERATRTQRRFDREQQMQEFERGGAQPRNPYFNGGPSPQSQGKEDQRQGRRSSSRQEGFNGFGGHNNSGVRMGIFVHGIMSGAQKEHYFRKLSAENIRTNRDMVTFTEVDRTGKKHLTLLSFNDDGTINITWNAESKKNAVTLKGFADDIKNFDDSDLRSQLAKQSDVARANIRNRKATEVRFNTSKNAQYYLNPSWVKSTRKQHKGIKGDKVDEVDALTKDMIADASRLYKMYASGQANASMELVTNKWGFAGDGSVAKGLRGVEQLKDNRRRAVGQVTSNILWRITPAQEFNSTYLGTGYRYLFGRGSALYSISTIGAALNAKDELRTLNRKTLIDASPSNISLTAGGRKFNLRSARDRRALNKELRALSKAELKIDITRLSNRSLKKTLSNGTFEGRALTAEQKNMFETALRLKGISEGSLSALTAVQYLNGIGVKLYNGGLSQNTLDILEKIGYTNIDISSLSEGNIVDILSRLSDKNIKVPDDLSDFFERARRLQSVNLDKKEGINALLNEISLAGKNIGEAGLVRGSVNISELSTKQIKMLLKNLPQNSEMANLLNQTLKLRELLDKKSKLLGAISKMRKMGGAMMRNAMFKLRGHALGDGMYAFYSAYRTTRTVVEIFQALRVIRTSNKAAFRHFLEKGKVGGLRYKIRNSGHFRRKYARMDRREAKMFKKAQKKAHKRQAKINKRKVRINKVKGRLSKRVPKRFKKMPKGLQKFGRGFKKLGKGLSKSLNVVLKPFKFVTGVVNKAKQAIMEKLIIPLIKYTLIFVGAIVIIQIAMGLFSAAADGLYSIIQPLTNDTDTEIAGEDENYSATNELGITRTENYTIEESLTYNSVELCINLDSAFKYYIEKYYEESKVINAVKDSIKEENEDELKSFYDPAANKYLNLKRLGTTLNKIQTGIYYSYYNGDAEEIGFKSNSKDIASMANAWIGADYHAKGLYKSYVEKLWNYSHMVAYAPRKVSDTYSYSTYRTGDDTESYGDNKYVYECASGKESSECYENEYSYYCNEASSKVYTDKKIRTDIKNGADKTTPTDKTGTPSGLVTQTLKDTSEVEYLTKSYNVTNGIAEYNANGCTNDILTYHDGSGTNVTAEVVNTTKGGYNTTKNLPSEEKSNGRLENVTISFWSSSTKPAGCNNWHEISYAVKVSGTIVEKKAYYCTGCAVKHNILNDEGKTKAFTSSHVANDEIIHIVPQKKAVHTGTKAQTIGGNTWYAKGSLSGCSEKLYYTHTLGTSHSGCNNYETVKSSVSTTTKCSGVCYKNPQYGKSYYYVTKVSSNKTKYEKVRTSNGLEYKLLYRADALKITGTVSAPPTGYSMKTPYKSKTQSVSLSQVSNLGTLTYTATNVSAYIYYSSINLSDGYTYIYDIKINGKVIMDTNLDSKITNTDKTDITYYPNTCNGTPADKHTTSTSVTTYKCKGHERCAGYLKDNPQDININYGSSYCCEHTLMHYCTGHVDLNIAVVTLFLNDTNSLAFLGVPKEVTTSEVNISNLMDLFTGETYEHLYDVQTDKEGTTYLYNNAFSNSKFERFDYEKFPLPSLSTWTEFSLDLKGKAVKDPGNFGNPLDTLRWMPDFVKDDVAQAADNTKSLNSVVSAWFSTFNKDIWEDRNDGFNSVAKVTAHHTQSDNSKFGKHHYFDGWFTYNKDGKLEMVEDDMPRDNGAYGRAVESLKEDWYDAYKIAFPGAYNSRPSNEEVERIEKTLTAVGTNANKMKVAKSLLKSIGDTYTNSGIKFAVDQYQEFYKAINGCENNQIKVAYTTSQAFSSSYTYQAKVFRRTLGVKSLEENKNVDNTITGLTAGDLIGAGDEVYVVIYTDVNATGVGIAKGHVIVATVNGAANLDSTDQIHLFSFTTEYIKKKSQLFWVYKCQ